MRIETASSEILAESELRIIIFWWLRGEIFINAIQCTFQQEEEWRIRRGGGISLPKIRKNYGIFLKILEV